VRVDRRLLTATLRLPPRVAWFYLRAQLLARRRGDRYSVQISSRPEDLAPLLAVAKGRRHVVELGTGMGWATAALVLADRQRQVITYDPNAHEQRESYLRLIDDEARARIHLRPEMATEGPADDDPPVELLFIDISGHTRMDTILAFMAWQHALAPNAVVAFHDYGSTHPGIAQAITDLGLRGGVKGRSLFVWHTESGRTRRAHRSLSE
jgi:predicted O-methyltransferase YrrM